MLRELNAILYRVKESGGNTKDFDILYMSDPVGLNGVSLNGNSTLLQDLADRAPFISSYEQVNNHGGAVILERLNYKPDRTITRSVLIGHSGFVLELWEIIPVNQTLQSGTDGDGDGKSKNAAEFHVLFPAQLFIAEPLRDGDNKINDFIIKRIDNNLIPGYPKDGEEKNPDHKISGIRKHLEQLLGVSTTGITQKFTISESFDSTASLTNYICLKAGNSLLIAEEISGDSQKHDEKVQKLNKQLLSKNRELRYLNSELRAFTAIAASDYKETLKRMYTSLEYIITHDASVLSNEGKANLRRVQSGVQKMKLLTEDIISFNSLQAAPEDKVIVDLNSILQQVKSAISNSANGVEPVIDCSGLSPIVGYPTMIYLLFHHLFDNAIKFKSSQRRLHILVECSRINGLYINHADAAPDTFYDVVRFTDNGIGFEPLQAAAIFTIFHKIDQGVKTRGSGIGLAYCRKIMQLHDGFITAEGYPDQGASFTCYFPYDKDFKAS